MKKVLLILIFLFVLTSCTQVSTISTTNINYSVETDQVFIEKYNDSSILDIKVEEVNLKDDFIIGADISSLNEVQLDHAFYDVNGEEKDFFEILKNNGFNYIRLRQFVEPFDEEGNLYGGGSNSLENNIELIKRANDLGIKVLLDFHYSDFWADPQNQVMPRSFEGLNEVELLDKVYDYTYNTLDQIDQSGGQVSMVQIGNEINNGLMHPYGLSKGNMYKLLKSGIKATNDFDENIKIMIHYAGVDNTSFYNKLLINDVDFDVIGLSYYPKWHGTVDNLKNSLLSFEDFSDKEVVIAEYSYAFTDFYEGNAHNKINSESEVDFGYKFSVQGQTTFIRDVYDAINSIDNGVGAFYWEVAWLPGESTSWANDYAVHFYNADYNYNTIGHANQSLFSYSGKALKSIEVFNLMKTSNDTDEIIQIIQDKYYVSKEENKVFLTVLTSMHRYITVEVDIQNLDYGVHRYCINNDICTLIDIS